MDDHSSDFTRSLSRLIRGLSMLFWGLPITLIISIKTAVKDRFELQPLDFFTPIISSAILLIAIFFIGNFKKSEKKWGVLIDRAKFFGIINLSLSPFIYWRLKVPEITAFSVAVWLFFVSNVFFLLILNRIIQQLTMMLPDKTLRLDAKNYGDLNQYMFLLLLIILFLAYLDNFFKDLPDTVSEFLITVSRFHQWIITVVIVIPLAMTMALLWKTRETILTNIFNEACKNNNPSQAQS
ncbi:MAG: hypothetical protein ACP5MG_06505 [Verrucomicrobiia bacterium]